MSQKLIHMVTEVWSGELGSEENRVKLHDNYCTFLLGEGLDKTRLESMASMMNKMLTDGLDDILKKIDNDKAS